MTKLQFSLSAAVLSELIRSTQSVIASIGSPITCVFSLQAFSKASLILSIMSNYNKCCLLSIFHLRRESELPIVLLPPRSPTSNSLPPVPVNYIKSETLRRSDKHL